MSLRKDLTRLAYVNPGMREDLVPLLLEGRSAGYSIGPGGLTETKTGLHIQPGTILYYGASSSPKKIIVTGIRGEGRDAVVQFKTPDGAGGARDTRAQRWIFEDLAISGSTTWLQRRGKYFPALAKSIKNMLAGKPGKPINVGKYLRGQERVDVRVEATQDADTYPRGDAWYAAERYGGVGGGVDGTYSIRTDRARLEKLENDNRFSILSVK